MIPLAAVEGALARRALPPPGVVLTFDDGYREHLDTVAPILLRRGCTATFYVATGLHGAGRHVAVVDAWYWLLDHANRRKAEVPLPDGARFLGRLDTLEDKTAWITGRPKHALLDATPAQQQQMLEALESQVGRRLPADLAARLYLRREEWTELADLGMRLGAHSVTHPRLTQVNDDRLAMEVRMSVDTIAQVAGSVPFAYPDGDVDERVVRTLTSCGASSAVTCKPGVVLRGAALMRLTRFFVSTPRQPGPISAPRPRGGTPLGSGAGDAQRSRSPTPTHHVPRRSGAAASR